MKATLFKEVGYSLSKLIHDIDMGEIGLPDIQRPFVWNASKVRDLFDSMFKGFPVGYLLFWSNGTGNGARQIGTSKKQKIPRLLIVDGQQRLTSLYAVIKGKPVLTDDYSEDHIHIAFRPSDLKFEVADAAIKRDPEYIPDISALWANGSSSYIYIKKFLSDLREHREVSQTEENQLSSAIDRLYDIQNYPFTALELSSNIDEEHVAEVFVRINSKGVTLNQADFILTLMSVFWDEGRAQLEHFCKDARNPTDGKPSSFNHYIKPEPDQILRAAVGLGFRRARLKFVYSILRGKDMETDEFSDERRIEQFEVLKKAQSYALDLQNWHDFLKTLLRAGYRGGEMITSEVAFIYSYTLFLIGKKEFKIQPFILRDLIARWFFMSSLTGRYTGSPESRMEGDFVKLRSSKNTESFIGLLNSIIDDTLTEDYWNITLPNELATSSPNSPAMYAYFASLCLLDANVLFSKLKVAELLDPSLRTKKSSTERHHLFPKNYLKKKNITEKNDTNQIANYALVEWSDNINISDLSPTEYYPLYVQRFNREELERMTYWHCLPDNWINMNYELFLNERRKLMANIIRKGFESLNR
ncbi:MAG: DUF262 domain-containing protein [Ignavibacteriales bacterium]|nr:DUF262 domain-containing protein [Ignavibacteriales bacterium]